MFGKEKEKAEKEVEKSEETPEKKVAKKVTKKAPAKKSESLSSKKAKSAFYFKGRHYRIGDDVELPKEDLDFLGEKGKLE